MIIKAKTQIKYLSIPSDKTGKSEEKENEDAGNY